MGLLSDIGIGGAVGAIVGGAAGFFVGGPAGAAAGAKIGAGIGAAGGSGIAGESIQDLATAGMTAAERAQKMQQKAFAKQAQAQQEANRRQLLQQIRTARIQRARTVNTSTTGGIISSGAVGAGYSISQQFGSNIQYMQNQVGLLNAATTYTNLANKEQYRAERAQDFIGLLQTGSKLYGNIAAINTLQQPQG